MAATIISNAQPFGLLTNRTVAELYDLNLAITRLQAAVGNAASGFTGTDGTEYEGATTNFGVLASAVPGEKGKDFAFAVGTLANAWATFWTAAEPAIASVDNGATT